MGGDAGEMSGGARGQSSLRRNIAAYSASKIIAQIVGVAGAPHPDGRVPAAEPGSVVDVEVAIGG